MTTSAGVEARHQPWGLAALITIGGIAGLIASFVLTNDELKLAKNPNKIFSCDIGQHFSCASVMKSDQAVVFGFPNPWIGMMVFPVLITLGILLLVKVDFPEWIWAGLQVGVTLGVAFVTWLQYQTTYDIGALCLWCMLVWSFVIPIFVFVTIRNLRAWIPGHPVVEFLRDWALLILLLWYVLIGSLIYFHFWV